MRKLEGRSIARPARDEVATDGPRTLRLDVQHVVGDGQLDILLGVDAGQLRPHDKRTVLLVLVDRDQAGGAPRPAREQRPTERELAHPLVEHPVEPVEDEGRLEVPGIHAGPGGDRAHVLERVQWA